MSRHYNYRQFLNDKPTHRKYDREFQMLKSNNKFGIFWALIVGSFLFILSLTIIFNQ